MKVQYKELFPDEFDAALSENPLAFLPLGAMEFHGWHDVLGLDSIKAKRLCVLAAERTGGIVLPALSLGYDLFPKLDRAEHKNKAYDTYHIDSNTYQAVLKQYFEDIFDSGFKKLFVLAGHYPNKAMALAASKELLGKQIWVYTEADLVDKAGDHAGKWETSLMMALFPEYVDLKRGKEQPDRWLAVQGEDPSTSSAEYGQEMVERIVQAIQKVVQ